jgi:hypothetical protein
VAVRWQRVAPYSVVARVMRLAPYAAAARVGRVAPYAVAVVAVLPLLVPEVWSGFRLAASDPLLSVIAPTEQPLSVRSPGGLWAIGLVLLWFSLAYRQRRVSAWETGLVLAGGAAALIRLGNAWLDAAALVLPLAHQLRLANPPAARPPGPPALNTRRMLLGVAVVASLVAFGVSTVGSLPPALPAPAVAALVAPPAQGTVLADWRWAAEVQQRLGPTHTVLASAGLASESPGFWLNYLQVAQGHARWAADLRQLQVNLVVLESTDQQHAAAELVRTSPDWHVLFDAGGALIAERIQQ